MCVAPPPLRPDASHPTIPFSSTSTSTPARASHQPVLSPVTPPPTITTDAPVASLMDLAPSMDSGSLVHAERDRARPRGVRLRRGWAIPVRRDLRRDPEPRDPLGADFLGLVVGPQHGERERANRRPVAGEWDLADRRAGLVREQEGDLLPAPPAL